MLACAMRRILVTSVVVALSLLAGPVVAQTPKAAKTTAKAAAKPAAKPAVKPAVKPAPKKTGAPADAAAQAAQLEADALAAAVAEKARVDVEAAAAAAAAQQQAVQQRTADADAEKAQVAARQQATSARGLQARVRVLADTLAISLKRLPGDHRDQRFAVIPFEAVGAETKERSLDVVVADMLVTDLARDHRLPLVERAQLGTVMNELALQQSGAVDDTQALQVGKTAGARALIVGRVSDAGEFFTVSARALDAETGSVLAAEEAQLPKAELVAFSANAVVLRSRSGAAFRSLVVPGWGQSYNGDGVQGIVIGGLVGGLAVGTVATAGIGWYFQNRVYNLVGDDEKLTAPEKTAAAVDARQQANRFYTAAAVLGGATIVAWGANVIEAWATGSDVESLDAALARD